MPADPEYSSGELMRAIQLLRDDFKDLTSRYVPMDLYVRDRKEHSEDIAELRGENRDRKKEAEDAKRALEQARQREEDQKAKTRLMVLGLVLGPVVAAFAAWMLNGGLA